MAESFSLLVKPASGDCNLRCRHCFYLPKRGLFGPGAHRMDAATLECLIRRFYACPMPVHTFAWQGGEPTLMGLDFFREAVRRQQTLAPEGTRAANLLQTNGTLLDDAWGVFLRENRFLAGISLDGPAYLHDQGRRTPAGAASHADALRGYETLRRHGVDVNVLTLVSSANQDHPEEVYHYLRSLGADHHQYIECVEADGQGRRQPYALAPGRWGEFLCRVFDEWYPRDTRRVSVRLFDSVVSRLATGRPTLCSMDGGCRGYFVVEHNGDVFPCDFHVAPEWRLGNIFKNAFDALRADVRHRDFADGKNPRSARCSACRYLPLCMGDCPKNRRAGHSLLCEDWKVFYGHTLERFERLAARPAALPPPAARKKPGANDPCPCGSGRKWKKCCGRG